MTSNDSANEAPVMGEYAVHTAREGFGSIIHRPSGEIMHSRMDPMDEARKVYVEQSGLAERLVDGPLEKPLVLWDVGLGAAANAVATIDCHEELASKAGPNAVRPLVMVSFDTEIDPLRLALDHLDRFPYLDRTGPREIAERDTWRDGEPPTKRWVFHRGHFLDSIDAAEAPPEVIFYDMFSPKTSSWAWFASTFRRLFEVTAGAPTVLTTYTRSTSARAAMLAAGFWVARGSAVGQKEETTVAFTPAAARSNSQAEHHFLGEEWLGRWERSAAKFPADVQEAERPAFVDAIRSHRQFGSGDQ